MATRETTRRGTSPAGDFYETEVAATDSVELKLGAKGQYSWEIKCYFHPDVSSEERVARVAEIDVLLTEKYGEASA